MIFVDTAFVVAWISPNDALHTRAVELLTEFRDSPWLTTDCVLLEIGNSLARGYRVEAVETIENFLSDETIRVVELHPDLFYRAFDLFRERKDKSWGLIDCISFVVMKEHAVEEALTNDQHFEQAGYKALMRTK
jgi:predicted nucleic acid-binding protein